MNLLYGVMTQNDYTLKLLLVYNIYPSEKIHSL